MVCSRRPWPDLLQKLNVLIFDDDDVDDPPHLVLSGLLGVRGS